jgi:hypothetical protein
VKRRGLLTLAALATAALSIPLACGSNPIVVATIEVDAGPIKCEVSDAGGARATTATCPDGSFCSTSCGSKDGLCEFIGSDGCATSEPECGCDGISYFNECLRQAAHVGRAGAGSCDGQNVTTATSCPCHAGQYCAAVASQRLDSPRMPPFGPRDAGTTPELVLYCHDVEQMLPELFPRRVCWVLPDDCPTPVVRTVFGCDVTCIDECAAIREGGIYALCPTPVDASAN